MGVVITGMGAITSIGADLDEIWASIAEGRHGILPIDRFSTDVFSSRIGALLPGRNDRLGGVVAEDAPDPSILIALPAAREALRRADLTSLPDSPARIAIVLGTSTGGIHSRSAYEFTPPEALLRRHRLLARSGFAPQTAVLAEALGIEGPRLTVSTACASAAHALAHGRDLLLSGFADLVLAGGVDVVNPEVYAGFHAMGALSAAPCAPFSEPIGMSVGEGAGFVVMERRTDAERRGIAPVCALLGAGFSSDGHHPTAPDPTGAGVARAITIALVDAGLLPEAVDYVNAHGTGTLANDPAEWRGLVRALGERARAIPVSSTKSYLGHTLGAAGVLELIVTVLAMQKGMVPPTLSFTIPRGHGPPDPVAASAPRPADVKVAVSTNAAFGGANAALLVGVADRSPVSASASVSAPAHVVILGVGAVGPHGTGDLDAALRRGVPLWGPVDPGASALPLPALAARVPPFALSRIIRGADARGIDTVSRFLAAAASLAIADAGVRIRGSLRERAGLLIGASRLPWDSADEFWGSLRARGFDKASAPAFARIVMNAAAGAASRLLSLKGPLSVIASGPVSGLYAPILAADMLGRRDDADLYITGVPDELGPGMLVDHAYLHRTSEAPPVRGEGAACLVLARAGYAAAEGLRPIAWVLGAGLAGPSGLADAIHQALERAGASPEDVDAIHGSADGRAASDERESAALSGPLRHVPRYNPASVLGTSEALAAFSLAAAVLALRSGRERRVLVISADEIGGSAALLLGRESPVGGSYSSSAPTS